MTFQSALFSGAFKFFITLFENFCVPSFDNRDRSDVSDGRVEADVVVVLDIFGGDSQAILPG